MRVLLYATATLALVMISPDAVRGALAACASVLFEATPFVFAGALASHLLRRRHRLVEYLGCGCTDGQSARSIPVAAATWLLFGPIVAIARCLAALLIARILHRRNDCARAAVEASAHPLGELAAIVPAAALAGAAAQLLSAFDAARLSPLANAFLGAGLGFASPCGLGAVALAGALRVRAPIAAAAYLCVAGILDLRALKPVGRVAPGADAFAYLLLAAALGIVALSRGAGLVHPAFALALGCCASAAFACAFVFRSRRAAGARVAPAVMLVGALLRAPMPAYHASETTLTDLFPGERLTFSGQLARDGSTSAVVRYAITCCRADAAPVAVRLARTPRYASGTWLRIEGRIESIDGDLRLMAQETARIPAPSDPFIYR